MIDPTAMTIQPHPRWVIAGGCCLAFLGAAVNACYLIRLGTSVSHLTGDVSKVAMDAVEGRSHLSGAAINLLTAAIGFVLGAATAHFAQRRQHQPPAEALTGIFVGDGNG